MAYYNTKVADESKRLEARVAALEQALQTVEPERTQERTLREAALARAA